VRKTGEIATRSRWYRKKAKIGQKRLIYRPFMPKEFLEWLEARGVGFVDVPEEEYLPMGCNVLAIAPRSVVMLENLPGVKAGLEGAGCSVLTYQGLEISRKGEGGPTCLTRPLIRK
jgi:N-dimethylarginine dimethylaminohydrolase